jgi:hypothetical protein
VAVLGLGALAGLLLALQAGRRRGGDDLAASEARRLAVAPTLHGAVITFQTAADGLARIEYGVEPGPWVMAAEQGEPRRMHSVELDQLRPAQDYAFRVVHADGTRSPVIRFRTLAPTVRCHRLDYRVRSLVVEFTTEPESRCMVEYWPEGRPDRVVPVAQDAAPAGRHTVQVGLVSPGEGGVVRVSAVGAQGGAVALAEWPFEGLARRLEAAARALAHVGPERLVPPLLSRIERGARADQVAREADLAFRKAGDRLLEFLALVADVLAPATVPLEHKDRAYALTTPLLHVDAACEVLGVPYRTGIERSLPEDFRPSVRAPPGGSRKIVVRLAAPAEHFIPPSSAMRVLETGLTAGALAKSEEKLTFTLGPGRAYRRAAVYLPVVEFNRGTFKENYFDVTLNGHTPLVMRYDMRRAAAPARPGLLHSFDPRMLRPGTNELIVRLRQTPGLKAAMGSVPLDRVEIHLWRE